MLLQQLVLKPTMVDIRSWLFVRRLCLQIRHRNSSEIRMVPRCGREYVHCSALIILTGLLTSCRASAGEEVALPTGQLPT